MGPEKSAAVRWDRASFAHAISKIEPGWPRVPGSRGTVVISRREPRVWTKKDVLHILGKPDVIRPYLRLGEVGPSPDRGETWCYGTNGPNTMATLGAIVFFDGKVSLVFGGHDAPPPTTVISERELVAAMRFMSRDPSYVNYDTDALRYIQVANMLISKGRRKVLAILGEYDRVSDKQRECDWLFWLVRVAFTSTKPGGVFVIPLNGTSQVSDHQLRAWPTYPIVTIDDVPYYLDFGWRITTGQPQEFSWYMEDHEKEWVLRSKPIVPPDDPFLSYKKLMASRFWATGQSDERGLVLEQVLALVKDAYQPRDLTPSQETSPTALYQTYHRAFLRLGCHWDRKRQTYVRR